jgi:xylitol oxidase
MTHVNDATSGAGSAGGDDRSEAATAADGSTTADGWRRAGGQRSTTGDDTSNWAGNYTYTGDIVVPDSLDAVRAIVTSGRRVRALGTRHSFNALPDTEVLVHLGGLPSDPVIDEERRTVTVGAATRYGDLARYLHGEGLALHNLGSLPHISVGGATATGTHGSGDANGTLSSAVSGLQLVVASGDVIEVDRSTEGFEGMVVGLGAFGVVTRVTLDVRPTFDIRQDAFTGVAWDRLIEDFDAVMGSAYSVSVLTRWASDTIDHMWLKTLVTESTPDLIDATHLGAIAAPTSETVDEQPSNLTSFGVAGPWSELLPHFRLDSTPSAGEEIQTEYLVPRDRIREALRALRAIGERIDAALLITELRTVAADDLWLSGASGRDVVGVHFTFVPDADRVNAVVPAIEEILLPLGGRPHWGKHFLATAADLAPLYPRRDEWAALVERYDPTGVFRNRFIEERVLGG